MSTNAVEKIDEQQLGRSVRQGAIAGLGGGVVFGVIMALVGMLPLVGMLVRQNNAWVGLVVHMIISAIIGAGFGLVMFFVKKRPIITIVVGAIYGLFWWVLGALILMPLLLGMPQMVLVVDDMQKSSLLGHVLYGITTGLLVNFLTGESSSIAPQSGQ
jgi:uncharacterized membrane protein YagU involved in acid resistance